MIKAATQHVTTLTRALSWKQSQLDLDLLNSHTKIFLNSKMKKSGCTSRTIILILIILGTEVRFLNHIFQ